jgi:hypothetical protein
MKVERLHHVQLAMPAGAEALARGFYQELLGIPEVPKPANRAARGGGWFERGELRIHLGMESPFHPARTAHPALLVTKLGVLIERLCAAAHGCREEPQSEGVVRVFVDDPFGNRIEMLQVGTCTG